MKLHWGSYIAIFYTCFVIAMVSMVVKSTYHKMDLVEENYYQTDLDYENFRSKRQNAANLTDPVSIQYTASNGTLSLRFPEGTKDLKGKLTFFRPSNKRLDKTIEIKLDEAGTMNVPMDKNMLGGKWRVQLDWETAGVKFFKEEMIII